MLQKIKNLFQKEKQTKYFAEFRINGEYRKIELSKEPNSNSIKVGVFVLKVESYRKEQTKDTIQVIYECSYQHTKY